MTIDPSVVDPDDVEMLQDLVVAAVGDALANARIDGRAEARACDWWPADPRHVAAAEASSAGDRSHRAGRTAHRILLATTRHRSQDRATADLPLCCVHPTPRPAPWLLRSSPCATTSSSASAVSTSAPGRCVRSASIRAATTPGLCVVEEPLDVLALERTRAFKGRYHVLHGAISPVDGIGPERLHIRELLERVARASQSRVIATPRSCSRPIPRSRGGYRDVPGRAACASTSARSPRIARGIPVGWRPRVCRRGDPRPGTPGSA